jgi:hypothetical protein
MELSFGAASDGNNFLVAIAGDSTSANNITAQLVSQTGTLVGSRISTGGNGGAPGVAFDGSNYLMVWPDGEGYPNFTLKGRFVSPSGSLVNTSFSIAELLDNGTLSGIAFSGDTYLVVYYRMADLVNMWPNVYGRLVSPSGTVGEEITIGTIHYNYSGVRYNVALAFDGANFLVVWDDGAVKGRFVSPAGVPGSAFNINEDKIDHNPLNVAFDGTNYLVGWPSWISGAWSLFGQRIDKSGNKVGNKISLTTSPANPIFPSIAFDGTNYLVLWTDARNDTNHDWHCDTGEGTCWDIRAQYVSKTGTLVGSEIVIDADAGNQLGVVGFGWGKYLILANYIDTLQGGSVGDVYGMFLTPDTSDFIKTFDSGGSAVIGTYSHVQNAFDDAGLISGDIIKMHATTFPENAIFNESGKLVHLKGGYDSAFVQNILKTAIKGSLTIRGGTVIV